MALLSGLHRVRSGPGSSITIVVGGAAESLSAHPGTAGMYSILNGMTSVGPLIYVWARLDVEETTRVY